MLDVDLYKIKVSCHSDGRYKERHLRWRRISHHVGRNLPHDRCRGSEDGLVCRWREHLLISCFRLKVVLLANSENKIRIRLSQLQVAWSWWTPPAPLLGYELYPNKIEHLNVRQAGRSNSERVGIGKSASPPPSHMPDSGMWSECRWASLLTFSASIFRQGRLSKFCSRASYFLECKT